MFVWAHTALEGVEQYGVTSEMIKRTMPVGAVRPKRPKELLSERKRVHSKAAHTADGPKSRKRPSRKPARDAKLQGKNHRAKARRKDKSKRATSRRQDATKRRQRLDSSGLSASLY